MPPCGIVRAEFSVRDVPRLEGIVLGREIEIQGAGDQDRACPDRPERLPNVTTIERASADVARLPGRKLGKQVVGVPVLRVVGLPVDQQVLGLYDDLPRLRTRATASGTPGTLLGLLLGFEAMGSGLSAHLRHTGNAAIVSMMGPGPTGRKA